MNTINFQNCLEERNIENVYENTFKKYFKNINIQYPFNCDGYFEIEDNIKCLCEYKYDKDFSKNIEKINVLIQVLYYIKKFEDNGLVLPNIIFIGDKNECFLIHVNYLIKYLDENINWNISPSEAHKINIELKNKMLNDKDILNNIFVFNISDNFTFDIVINKIKNSGHIKTKIHMTEYNMENIFNQFLNIFSDITLKKISSNDLVSIFIGCITKDINYYQHPANKNTLICNGPTYDIKGSKYISFMNTFSNEYTIQEKKKFHEVCDRLIENTNRRSKGEFYTPAIWANYAYNRISNILGDTWNDDFYVWDSCCGTKNLTRDHKFSNLTLSTLEKAELDISKKYNSNAATFVMDFLNDDIEDKLDYYSERLLKAIKENKPIIIYINPPYMTNGTKQYHSFNYQNLYDEIGSNAKKEIYSHFLCKIMWLKDHYNLTNLYIGLFCNPKFLTGKGFNKFRKFWLTKFEYIDGFMFQASEFGNVKGSWGITFSIWKCGETKDKINFNFDLCENKDGFINIIGKKTLYNTDDNNYIGNYCDNIKFKNNIEYPNRLGHPLKYIDTNVKICEGCIAQYKRQAIGSPFYIINTPDYKSRFKNITKDNFKKYAIWVTLDITLFKRSWINEKDELLAPNENHPKFEEFQNDCIIYSIFDSNQSVSLDNIEYHNKKWRIKNEYFWMSNEDILNLANKYNNDICYESCIGDSERTVYNIISNLKLSKEAKNLLNKAKELVIKSFEYRQLYNEDHPEFQINNWDCGYYQIMNLCKEYCPNELNEFKNIMKILRDKINSMVYEIGCLK